MTEQEIDALVAQVGDEILERLGRQGGAAPGPDPAPVTGWESPDLPLPRRLDLDLTAVSTTERQVARAAARAAESGLRAAWTTSGPAAAAERVLRGSKTRLGVVVGYPLGATATPAKALEAEIALTAGADELDVTALQGAALAEDSDALFADVKPPADLAASAGVRLTVTLEPSLLAGDALIRAAAVSRLAGAAAVRMSTGLNSHDPVTAEQVARLRSAFGDDLEIAAGGVRSFGRLTHLLRAGAKRVVSTEALALLADADD